MKTFFGMLSIFIVAILLTGCCSSTSSSTPSAKDAGLSLSQIKTNAVEVPYDQLFRENENYVGKIVHIRGEIDQAVESNGRYVFRIATGESQYVGYLGDIVWVNYQGDRFIEKDVVEVWGRVIGLKKYQGVLGNEVTIPEINSLQTELVEHTK